MTPTLHQRAKEIFLSACDLEPSQRATLLERECGADAGLRAQVERLLANDDDPRQLEDGREMRGRLEGLLDDNVAPHAPTELPERIGNYRILEVLGEGGFGTVYKAEQSEPIRRTVALKVIRPGMDSRQMIARFAVERQALAIMDHPNVARVFDAGETDAGRPYFVMELVAGVPITQYCDAQNLDLTTRLKLFTTVCHAVQHAHQKGVIHRDIKPSNVLVCIRDDAPVAKVIDFGIAKAMTPADNGRTLLTEQGQMIGTPEYMSPEQVEAGFGAPADVDTRADVYALGAVLYELLTGCVPFESQTLRSAGFDELRRVIRDVDPPKPSTRVLAMNAEAGAKIARQRRAERAALSAELRRELDWIPLKALRKDRTERYASPTDLARDVQNYLEGRPLEAGPQSTIYRLRKTIRRNQAAVIAAGLLLATLLLGLAGTGWGLLSARRHAQEATIAAERERQSAEAARHAQTDAESAQRAEERQRQRAEAINQFIQTSLQSADPFRRGKPDMRVSEAMQKAVQDLDAGAFRTQPETDAELRLTIARILLGNGRAAEALPLAERALAVYEGLRDGDPGHAAPADGGSAAARPGSPSEPRRVQSDHAGVAASEGYIAWALHALGREAESELHCRTALEMFQRLYPGDHPGVAKEMGRLGVILQARGRYTEAEGLHRLVLEMRRRLFTGDHVDVANALNNLGAILQIQDKLALAEPIFREALAMFQRLYPDDHPLTARTMTNLAIVVLALDRYDEAEPLARDALDMYRRLLPRDHPDVAYGLTNLAFARQATGRAAEAEPLLREALEMRARLNPGDHPDTARSSQNLGNLLASLGRHAEAEPLLREALEMNQRVFPGDHPGSVTFGANLAACLANLDRLPEALETATQALAMAARTFPEQHPTRIQCERILAQIRSRAEASNGDSPLTPPPDR